MNRGDGTENGNNCESEARRKWGDAGKEHYSLPLLFSAHRRVLPPPKCRHYPGAALSRVVVRDGRAKSNKKLRLRPRVGW